jgi:NAD(P)-dependent dehydrogenase (short-subunit alcohol dehydrogenase family)
MQIKGIVVGATGSIGKQIVADLSNKNITVASIGRDKKKLSELTLQYNNTVGYGCDITNTKNCRLTIKKILKDLKEIDFIVFAHGVGGITPIGEINEIIWDKMFDTNLKFAFFFAQEITKIMKKQHRGKIIFVSSIHAKKTYEDRLVYAATKAALESVTRSMSIDLAKYNISVNAIAPGQLMTDMQTELIKRNPKLKSFLNNIKKITPTKRFTKVEDVGEIISQLILFKNNQLTGTIINIDGGITNIV